ncbi:hypothetical protein ADEAN_000755000 [Angomonas deanei]|uniref:Uncharacterized protein n=1 Tax=Angomonas deanei TaxID=59799 RepID=A0A7G2CJR5_9TRYP|nr:hypothetical protein ADEAN_000755000 [Angomonas deanei]
MGAGGSSGKVSSPTSRPSASPRSSPKAATHQSSSPRVSTSAHRRSGALSSSGHASSLNDSANHHGDSLHLDTSMTLDLYLLFGEEIKEVKKTMSPVAARSHSPEGAASPHFVDRYKNIPNISKSNSNKSYENYDNYYQYFVSTNTAKSNNNITNNKSKECRKLSLSSDTGSDDLISLYSGTISGGQDNHNNKNNIPSMNQMRDTLVQLLAVSQQNNNNNNTEENSKINLLEKSSVHTVVFKSFYGPPGASTTSTAPASTTTYPFHNHNSTTTMNNNSSWAYRDSVASLEDFVAQQRKRPTVVGFSDHTTNTNDNYNDNNNNNHTQNEEGEETVASLPSLRETHHPAETNNNNNNTNNSILLSRVPFGFPTRPVHRPQKKTKLVNLSPATLFEESEGRSPRRHNYQLREVTEE